VHHKQSSGYGDAKIRGDGTLELRTVVELVDPRCFIAFCSESQADHEFGRGNGL
jgi:hypothetical protein